MAGIKSESRPTSDRNGRPDCIGIRIQSRSRKPDGAFKEYGLGFVHVDVKHLPKLRVTGGGWRKRYLFVAIDRRSRSV